MPRIDAPTVVEHHALRRADIVAASRDLLATGGVAAVTPAAVAGRTGLARTSVYQYFPSTSALVAAAIEATFAAANTHLAGVVAGAGDPRTRVHTYVRESLLLAGRDHGPFRELALGELPPECIARVRELHAVMLAPLRSAVDELGVRDAGLMTTLVFGAISAGARAVEAGADPHAVAARTVAFVDAGLASAT